MAPVEGDPMAVVETDPVAAIAALLGKGRAAEALEVAEQALGAGHEEARLWIARGDSLRALGRKEEAAASFDQALKRAPEDPQAWVKKAEALDAAGIYVEAAACYEKAIELQPRHIGAWNSRGVALTRIGRMEDALSCFTRALDLDPRFALARFNRGAAEDVLRLSFGWPRYARVLVEAVRAGDDLVGAFVRELRLGGRLEVVLRATYESLLLRSRGYGSSKALLGMIAEKPGQNLTSLYRAMGRSPGATRDYLVWLVEVDAVRMVGKRYHYVDGLLAHWVRLHARGRLSSTAEIEATALEILGADREPRPAATRRPKELLMEID
jgi:tetratricopeptide (TPR) repeat protein